MYRIPKGLLALHIFSVAVDSTAGNGLRLARNFMLNNLGPARTFDDMTKTTAYRDPPTLFDDAVNHSSLDVLHSTNKKGGFILSAGRSWGEDGYEITLNRAGTIPYSDTKILVKGSTTNKDFYNLAEALDGAQNFHQARKLFAEKAGTILGDKKVKDFEDPALKDASGLLGAGNDASGLSLGLSNGSLDLTGGICTINLFEKYNESIALEVKGDTPTDCFYALADILDSEPDPEKAKALFLEKAPEILGDHLVELKQREQPKPQPLAKAALG
ncbi:MAG: hypothetical protein GC204_09385 [Chloroflexi bacterium]|nr:hypothetical protein [Chloroflexota bacterium]